MGPVRLNSNLVGKFSLTSSEMTPEIAAAIVRERQTVPPPRDLG